METDLWNVSNYTLTPYALAPLIVGILTAVMGTVVFLRERGTLVSTAFGLMAWTGAAWLLSYVGIYSAQVEALAIQWAKIENGAVVYIPSMVILFAVAAARRYREHRWFVRIMFAISTLFCGIILQTDWFVSGVYTYPWGYYARYGPMSIPFLFFFFVLLLMSLYLFWMEYRSSMTQTQRGRFRSYLIAFGIAYLGAVDYLPAYGMKVYPLGYLPIFIFNVLVARAIWLYRLIDITPAFAANQILKTMADALLVLDCDGTIRVANQAACQLFGYTESELIDKPIWIIGSRFLPGERLGALLRRRVVQSYELKYGEEGKMRTLDICASAIRNQSNRSVGVVCIARDITDRKQAEEKLRQAHEELKKSHEEIKAAQMRLIQAAKMESIGRLAAGVAHEVKNPLAVIYQGLSYLSSSLPADDGNVSLVINYAKDAVKNADTVIRRLLDFSVQKELELHPAQLNEAIEHALLLVKHELEKSHINLIKTLDPQLPALALDKNKMEQVFVNLFVNAAQAMPKGGTLKVETLTKELSPEDKRAWNLPKDHFAIGQRVVAAQVEDTGSGIPPETLPKIFDPFFTTKPTGKGIGLGLAVTKNIIEMHGGTICIRNCEKKGVQATLVLKVAQGGDEVHG